MSNKKLNPKQERFCDEYVIDLNATQAAIRAGYSEKTARQTAYEILTKPYIQDRIAELQKDIGDRNAITADFVLNGIKDIALLGEQENNRLKAFELLGKHVGIYEKDNKQSKTEITPEWTVTIKKPNE